MSLTCPNSNNLCSLQCCSHSQHTLSPWHLLGSCNRRHDKSKQDTAPGCGWGFVSNTKSRAPLSHDSNVLSYFVLTHSACRGCGARVPLEIRVLCVWEPHTVSQSFSQLLWQTHCSVWSCSYYSEEEVSARCWEKKSVWPARKRHSKYVMHFLVSSLTWEPERLTFPLFLWALIVLAGEIYADWMSLTKQWGAPGSRLRVLLVIQAFHSNSSSRCQTCVL